jgi:hypothetical protein
MSAVSAGHQQFQQLHEASINQMTQSLHQSTSATMYCTPHQLASPKNMLVSNTMLLTHVTNTPAGKPPNEASISRKTSSLGLSRWPPT